MINTFTRHVARMLGLLLAIVATAIAIQPLAVSAQATTGSSQTAGSSTVTFSDAWQYNVDASDAESVFLSSADLRGTVFIYAEVADSTPDSNTAITQFTSGFFDSFGDGDEVVVNSGVVPTDHVWQLYAVSSNTVPYGAFVSANAGSIPGVVIITVLAGPAGSFDLAVESVQQDISVDGAGTTLSTLDAATLSASLSGDASAQPTATTGQPTSTADGQTSGNDTGRGGLTLPPLGGTTTTPTEPVSATTSPTEPVGGTTVQLTESVTVDAVVVAYGGDWVYNEGASSQDEIAFFTHATSLSSLFGYATTPDSSTDVLQSLRQFNDGFFSSYGGTNVVEVTTETLPSGHAYSLYTLDRDGVPYVVVTVADITSAQGEFRVQVFLTERAEFDAIFPTVQQSFQIDGVGAMSELDLAQLDALLGGGQQGQTTTTTGQTTSGSLADLQAADVAGTCDGIGWAIMAPDQIPASEADINYRSACAGGGAFVAFCGTSTGSAGVAPEVGTVWVRCDVTARADAGPLAMSPLDITLTDGSGTEYTLEFQALFGMSGVQFFPEEAIPAGQTARGTVVFAVPEAMTGPFVLSVHPEALQASGEQPGQIGIDGELQPFDVFGQ